VLGPGEQVGGEPDELEPDLVRSELEPDLVRSEVVQWQVPQSGVFRQRIRSSARARRRCCTSRSASRPPATLVANTVMRQPSLSVMRSCAPGCGRSRRAITRIPAGHALPVPAGMWRVSSATWAPSRGNPSGSNAAFHACRGRFSSASRIVGQPPSPIE